MSSNKKLHQVGSYDSEFEYDSETERKRKKYEDLATKEKKKRTPKGHKRELEDEFVKEEGRIMRPKLVSMNAFDRHKLLVNNYIMYYGGRTGEFERDTSRDKTDMDVIREHHKFLWTEDDDPDESWGKRLSKQYYDKLFKEYCIADLSRYKENKIAMRWRIEKEVQEGTGQFLCGNRKCNDHEDLKSWEVNFGYMEDGEKKNALVKLRLCPDCSYKLNYHHKKKEAIPKYSKHHNEKRHKKTKKESVESEQTRADDTGEASGVDKTGDKTSDEPDKAESSNVWSGPAKIIEEKSREEEFDEYFTDMFL